MLASPLWMGSPGQTLQKPVVQVLRCRQLGINAIVILEQFSELDTLLDVASCLRVQPVIGMRAKLTTRHGGHWCEVQGTWECVRNVSLCFIDRSATANLAPDESHHGI